KCPGMVCRPQPFRHNVRGSLQCVTVSETRMGQTRYTKFMTLPCDPDSRETFLKQLSDRGYDTDRLNDIRRLVDAPDSDLFDVLGYVMFTNDPKTRHDRADAVKHSGLANLQEDMKALLIIILDAYERHGEHELASTKLGQFLTARYGSVGEAKNRLGGLPEIKDAFHRMQAQLYSR
ncbi:hypothetical protein M3N55_05380, partial [Roseibaca sp. V10]